MDGKRGKPDGLRHNRLAGRSGKVPECGLRAVKLNDWNI
jgi:hypothetical protein